MGSNSVKDEPCVFCGTRGSPKGEHAIPQAVVRKLFPTDEGPFTTFKNGDVLRVDENIERPKVPCCNDETKDEGPESGCNAKLNKRFELPAQNVASDFWRKAFKDKPEAGIAIAGADREATALWFLKTILLAHHDQRVGWLELASPERPNVLTHTPDLWEWMVDWSPPPRCVSLWLSTGPAAPLRDDYGFKVLIAFEDQEVAYAQRAVSLTYGGIRLNVVYHPGGIMQDLGGPPGVQLWPHVDMDLTWEDLEVPAIDLHHLMVSHLRVRASHSLIQNPVAVPTPAVAFPPPVGVKFGALGDYLGSFPSGE